ncbi:type II secretion system protein [bacterium]|nr:type II secretion system protein [bacterium]
MKKILAFTLAEVLIVIGILGVVAALTIPTLNSEAGSKEKVTRLKKSYSVLTDAFDRMMADMGPLDEIYGTLETNLSENVATKMASYMKTSSTCADAVGTANDCSANTVTAYSTTGTAESNTINKYPGFVLTDGTSVSFNLGAKCPPDSAVSGVPGNTNVCGMVYVDVDGKDKSKNEWGKDVFAFYVTTDRITPVGLEGDTNIDATGSSTNCIGAATKIGCTGWVITNGNEDYLNTNYASCTKSGGLDWAKGRTACTK